VARVRDVLPADRKLRLDANRAWCLRDAIEFGLRIQDLNVEYVEEPTGRPTDLEAFYEATQVPYALDETLREAHPLEAFPHSTALILKPTLLGDLAAIAQLTKHDKLVVISGAFESGVGTAAAARWSHVVAPGVPAGLEAHTRLRADVLTSRLRFDNGCLYVPASTFVCREQLSRVA
jgi:O-succinylbenzoate synthase